MFSAIEKWVSLITGKKTARGAKVAGQMALSSHITTTRFERKLFGWIDFLFLFYKSPHRSALNWFMIRKWNSDNSIRLPKKFFLRSISFQMSLQMFRNHNFSYFTIKSIYFGGYQRNNCYTKVFFGEQHTITIVSRKWRNFADSIFQFRLTTTRVFNKVYYKRNQSQIVTKQNEKKKLWFHR